ncbi:MAG: ABC transporter transmembrane domain-containing protein [Methylotetracoccus sp.]|jgi:putative ATP-binding cassette transporter|nr:ABC transporter transmembrane domain-containing protein [Methylotetracoccus sp.]
MLRIPINEQGWGLFLQLLKNLARSEIGGKAIGLFVLLAALLIGVNGLNVLNSYVGRDFMTAIANRDMNQYVVEAGLYLGVFAASTVVAVYVRYAEESLGLLWREWMTRRFVELYLQYPTYYRMNDALIRSTGMEHPDQRIADDVRSFTTTTLSFVLMLLNGLFTVVAFSSVLWRISPTLFGVAVLYAVVGSLLAVRLGSTLVDLNNSQLDKEAGFRAGLLHVTERAESIALLHREKPLLKRLFRRLDDLVNNFRRIIRVNRNLGFFITGYNYLMQVLPILLVAPLFMRSEIEFGVVTQSAMAFITLVSAFSLIITQFQSISSFMAVVQRLINLWYGIELAQTETVSGIDWSENGEAVAYENLTLRSTSDGHVILKDLSATMPQGQRTLITCVDNATKESLFKATAGILDIGTGRVLRPRMSRILFLPERAYLPPGTLREALVSGTSDAALTDEQIVDTLKSLSAEAILQRAGGLDRENEWDSLLSVQEQQVISLARILLASPQFAVIDLPSTDLNREKMQHMLRKLTEANISYLVMGRPGQQNAEDRAEHYDAVLEIDIDGKWAWQATSGLERQNPPV